MSQPAEAKVKTLESTPDSADDIAEESHTLVPDEAVVSTSAEGPPLVVRVVDEVPVLELPDDIAFDDLRAWVDDRGTDLVEQFDGRAGRLDLGQRHIELFDLRRLIHHLEGNFELSITGLYVAEHAIQRFAERELKLKLFPTASEVELEELELDEEGEAVPVSLDPDGIREAQHVEAPPVDEDVDDEAEVDPELPGRRTLHVNRTVRSGNAVRFDGDVTIFGDVNPGAQVTASGSIIVLGALKGVAHAGATGDEDAFILGLQLQPTQLRIGRRIAIASDGGHRGPEIAVVRDERIIIEAYRSSAMARSNPPPKAL